MKIHYIHYLMLIYQTCLIVGSRTESPISYPDNVTSTSTSTDDYGKHFQNLNSSDALLPDDNSSAWTTTNTSSFDGNLMNVTGEINLPPLIWKEMEFYEYLLVDQKHQVESVQRHYDMSYQVDACGMYCDGNGKIYTLSLCGDFSCSDCFCDELCSSFGDCCPDKNGTLPLMVADHTLTCVGPSSKFSTYKSYYMVKKCPSNSTEINQELYPVTSLLTNRTYYNELYALCNNETYFVTWGNACANNSQFCVDSFLPPQYIVMPRSCILYKSDQVVSQCNVSGAEPYKNSSLNNLCQSTEWFVQKQDVVYKNIFCYICNGEEHPYNCINDPPKYYDFGVSIGDLVSFMDYPLTDTEVISTNCSEFDWMDPITEKCRIIRCLDGRYLSDGECLITNHTIENTQYYFYIEFPLQEDVANFSWTHLCLLFENNVPKMLNKFDPLYYTFSVDKLQPLNENLVSGRTGAVGLRVDIRSWNIRQTFQFEQSLLEFIWNDWVFITNDSEVVLKPRPVDMGMTVQDSLYFYFNPVNKTCCSDTSYFEWLIILEKTIKGFKAFPSNVISLASALPCPYIILDNDEYETDSNNTLTFLNSSVTLPKGSHRKFGTDIQVCVSTMEDAFNPLKPTSHKVKTTTIKLVKGYLSLVCTCISLLSILLTLITFFRFPELRTLPTKNTMFLSASIFVAQATFQFGADQTENKTICQIVGIAIHFLWLSVIFWMNVCCFHMFHVFVSSKVKISNSRHWAFLLKYSLYVYGMSCVIVSATVAANHVLSNGKSLGYGGRLCYLNSALLVGLAFVLPLGLIIIANILFFSWTVFTIYRIRKIEERSPTDHRNVFVYIKLSTLTGGFWLLAILAEVTNADVLSIISVVLNGSQGLFIFVSYILNKRVYKLWTRSCGKQVPINSRSSQYTSSSKL